MWQTILRHGRTLKPTFVATSASLPSQQTNSCPRGISLHQTYTARRAQLARRTKGGGRIQLSEGELVETAEQLQRFFDASLERGHEGVVAKRLDSD